jgi:drug/metabolite transporter (DMT)-like permease
MQLSSDKTTPAWFPFLLISPFFLWGTAMVAMKGVIPHTTPLFLAGIRIVPAGILVLLFAALGKRSQPKSWQAWAWIIVFALIDGAMFQGFLGEGLARTGAGLGSVTIDSQPLAVTLLSSILFGEIIGFWGWLGLSFGIAGISLIGIPDPWIYDFFAGTFDTSVFSWTNLANSGEGLMLIASLSMAVGTVLVPYITRYVDPVVATGWHLILGGLPLFALSGMFESEQLINLNLHDWFSLGYSTIFGSAIAYGVFFYFASRGNLTSLSSLTFLTPIFALIFGNLVLGEILSVLQWLGVCLTLVSIYLINQREQLQEKFARFLIPAIQIFNLDRRNNIVAHESTHESNRESEREKLLKLQLFSKESSRE